jgi:hypothetical protein
VFDQNNCVDDDGNLKKEDKANKQEVIVTAGSIQYEEI